MSWTYLSSQLTTSTTMQVRFLCGDTSTGDQLLQNEEIDYLVTLNNGSYAAAAAACDAIASKFSREADKEVGDLSISMSQRAIAYQKQAKVLRVQGSIGTVKPYLGGQSVSDKDAREAETDRVKPGFVLGAHNNEQRSTGWC